MSVFYTLIDSNDNSLLASFKSALDKDEIEELEQEADRRYQSDMHMVDKETIFFELLAKRDKSFQRVDPNEVQF